MSRDSNQNVQHRTDRTKKRRIIVLFILVAQSLGIISAIDAVMTTRTSQGAIAWAVSLVAFPYVSVPAYWVFGRSKFEGYVEARRENEEAIETLLGNVTPQIQASFVKPDERIPEYEALMHLAQLGMTGFNRTELLIDGEATYDSILEGISTAKNYILVEFYIVRDDQIGRRLKNALIDRSQNGVRVYFVYDEIGSKDLPQSYGKELRAAGVEFSPFNTTQGWRNRFQLNFRNHRKIVVVDGHSAWVGGLNVGDDYLGANPKLSPWRDTHMRIDGPAAAQVQLVFLSDWYWATRKVLELDWGASPATNGDAQVMIIASSPAQMMETATLFFTHAINSARKRIWITSPYFVPDEGIVHALHLAALRGVDVRIIVPQKPDQLLVQPASYNYMEALAGSGIRFYQFTNGFLHQKVMLIDDKISTVGTANFDNRSFRLNFELIALVRNRIFAKKVRHMLEDDMAHSQLVDLSALKASSYWHHFFYRFARLFAPVL